MDRGTDSIDNLLSYILFSITPTIVDIIVAIVYFISQFNAWFGLIVFSTMVLYIGTLHDCVIKEITSSTFLYIRLGIF